MKSNLHTILLVDDNEADNYYHRIIIQDSDLVKKILVCTSPINALELLADDHSIQLVFLDINMPILNGFRFLERFKDLGNKSSKIVILTNSTYEKDIERTTHYDFVIRFCTKPLTELILQELIQEHFS